MKKLFLYPFLKQLTIHVATWIFGDIPYKVLFGPFLPYSPKMSVCLMEKLFLYPFLKQLTIHVAIWIFGDIPYKVLFGPFLPYSPERSFQIL